MKTHRIGRMAALGLSAAILVLGWYTLAPTQLGGRTAYVTTSGTSMEPLLHAGDLAVVRASGDYRVGDVVAYRNAELGAVVLHRIVAIQNGRYSFKGDNNTWVDDARPTAGALLGEMVFRVPGVGGRLRAVRTPWGLSTVAGVAAFGLIGGRRRTRRGKERHDQRVNGSSHRESSARASQPARPPRGGTWTFAAVSVGVGVLAAAVAAIAFALPATVTTHRDVAYEERGVFSYEASAGEHGPAVYGRSVITTGDPVYLRLTDAVTVGFDYRFQSDGAFVGGGTAGLVAVLSDGSGWARAFALEPARAFDGDHAIVSGDLDLRQLRAVIDDLEHLTGVERESYRVTVRPEISLDGALAGVAVHRSFAPELAFQLDALELQLPPASSPTPDGVVVDPVHPSRADGVTATGTAPRSFSVLGLEVPLRGVRSGAGATLGLALVGGGVALVSRRRAVRHGEAAVIAARYGHWLVPVRSNAVAGGRIVQVESFDSLRRIAEHYGHIVLHEQGDGFHAYSVDENGVTYRYRVANGTRA